MKRTPVNPWSWSLQYGFNQGDLIEGAKRVLYCAGQTALDENAKPRHEGEIRAQTTLALDNLEAVLKKADMTLSNVVRLTAYTTDVDAMIQNFDVLVERLDTAGVKPAQTLLGVARLAFPELLVFTDKHPDALSEGIGVVHEPATTAPTKIPHKGWPRLALWQF